MHADIVKRFAIEGSMASCEHYGNGHINETFLVTNQAGRRYILQRINRGIFKDVPALMRNIAGVTQFLARRYGDARRSLHLVPTDAGEIYLRDEAGEYWRMYDFVTDSLCLEAAETQEDFRQSALAFGEFQRALADYPAAELSEIIPHFHDTPDRYRQLHEAIERDSCNRLREVRAEVDFALAREPEAGALMRALADGTLPLRVTHNDTKLNNVLLDAATRKALCVIDLDTVMPGLTAFDFGDSIRFGAATAPEDTRELEKMEMSLDLYETFASGFVAACGGALTEAERSSLPLGAKLMTLECGVRFLTDYLSGDVYFRIHRPEHNLDRCRTQFKLVADMEKKADRMREIVEDAGR